MSLLQSRRSPYNPPHIDAISISSLYHRIKRLERAEGLGGRDLGEKQSSRHCAPSPGPRPGQAPGSPSPYAARLLNRATGICKFESTLQILLVVCTKKESPA